MAASVLVKSAAPRTAAARVVPAGSSWAVSGPWYLAGGAPVPVVAYQPKGAASLAASYANLANPGVFTAAPGVAPTWAAARGWVFDGSTQYLNSGVVPAAGWSAVVLFTATRATGTQNILGCRSASPNRYWMIQSNASTNQDFYGNDSTLGVGPQLPAGVLGFAGQTAYRGGVVDGTIPKASGVPALAVYVGGRNLSGAFSGSDALQGTVGALAIYNVVLSGPQMGAVSAAMLAL